MEVLIPVLVGVVVLVVLLDLLYGPKQQKGHVMREVPLTTPTMQLYLSDPSGNRVATATIPAHFTLEGRTFYPDTKKVWFEVEEVSDITHFGIVGWDVDGKVTTPKFGHQGPITLSNFRLTAVKCEGMALTGGEDETPSS